VQLVWLAEQGRAIHHPGFGNVACAEIDHDVWLQDLLATDETE
jgi:hypothetical protein